MVLYYDVLAKPGFRFAKPWIEAFWIGMDGKGLVMKFVAERKIG